MGFRYRLTLSGCWRSAKRSWRDLLNSLCPRSLSAASTAPTCLFLTLCSKSEGAFEARLFVDVQISRHMSSCFDLSFLVT